MNTPWLTLDFWSALMLMTVGVGVFVCALLVLRPRLARTPSLCLAGLIGIACWMNLDFIAMISGYYAKFPIIFHSTPLFFLMGPLYYGFAWSLAGRRIRPLPALAHALPAILFAANMAPHYLGLPGGEITRHYVYPIGGYWVMGVHLAQTAIYVLVSYRVIGAFRGRLLQTTAHAGIDSIGLLKKLTLGLLLFLIATLGGMLHMMFGGTHITAFEYVMAATLNVIAILAAWSVWSEPLPQQSIGGESGVDLPTEGRADNGSRASYARSGLGAVEKEALAGTIRAAMRDDRLYLNPDLRLGDLAAAVGSTPNHVSQVLNQDYGLNFFDFVNEYRVEEVKRRLAGGPGELTILGIALDSGFTSKSSFNRIFKKHAGKTPSAWMAEHVPSQ